MKTGLSRHCPAMPWSGAVDAETIWRSEDRVAQIVLPFEFYPDDWELDG